MKSRSDERRKVGRTSNHSTRATSCVSRGAREQVFLRLTPLGASRVVGLRDFMVMAQRGPARLVTDRFLLAHRKRIVEFAAAKRLPGMYPFREYVDAGGLMSYAPSNIELFRGAATYVDKLL